MQCSEKKMTSRFPQVFSVTRKAPELIAPARPTPYELKPLSDIDDQESLRFQIPVIFFYRNINPSSPSAKETDPVKAIREAISKALVYYYPFAGRIREGADRKLTVDCNGEGIMFLEAKASFKLEELGDSIRPPCPYLEELLYDVPGSDGIIGCPLLLVQVTRLKCGGFVLGLRLNHTMSDAFGLAQFLKAIEDVLRGSNAPSLLPVWQREHLCARDPPRVTCLHLEYEQVNNKSDTFLATSPNEMDQRSWYFGPREIGFLRNQLPLILRNCTTFELLAAVMWKCRTFSLQLDPNDTVQLSCLVTARGKMDIASGFYGNALAFPAVCSKAGDLCRNPLGYAVALVRKAKAEMSEEHVRSAADLMAITGRRLTHPIKGNFILTDMSKAGFDKIDLGLGEPVFAGMAGAISIISPFIKYRKEEDGGSGILVPIHLPRLNMNMFEGELKRMIQMYSKL